MVLQILGAAVIVAGSTLMAHAQDQEGTHQAGWPCAGTIDRSYALNAEATGGKVLLFRKTELAGITEDMTASSRHKEIVFRASARLSQGTYEFDVPVDSTIESAYFFVSLQCLESIEVVRPSGDLLHTDAADVENHRYAAVSMLTVKEPSPGAWKVRVAGRGVLSLIVSGRTDLRLGSVSFTDGGERVMFAARRETPVRVEANLTGAADQIAFQFISSSAAPMALVDLALEKEAGLDKTFAADVMLPGTEFRLAVTGVDPKGFRFQRVQQQLVVSER